MGLAQLGAALFRLIRRSRSSFAVTAFVNTGIIATWGITRGMAIPFLPGLESVQSIGLEDVVATSLEVGAVVLAFASLKKIELRLPSGRVPAAVLTAVVFGVSGIAAAQPHAHEDHADLGAAVAHVDDHHHGVQVAAVGAADSEGHTHSLPAMSWEEAQHELLPHVPHSAAGHSSEPHQESHPQEKNAESTDHHSPSGDEGEHAKHSDVDDGAAPQREHQTLARTDNPILKNWKAEVAYEPAAEGRGPAIRYTDPNGTDHRHNTDGSCKPTAKQRATADELLKGTKAAIARYDNNPRLAISERFVPYPIAGKRMFHIFNSRRYRDAHILVPTQIETFMYAMTDQGLKAVGGMFVYAPKNQDPPNPTGCILQWHQHTGAEGAISSFDPDNPDKSMWMAHVWTYGGLPPWRESKDGTESSSWFFGWRNIPMFCNGRGGCI